MFGRKIPYKIRQSSAFKFKGRIRRWLLQNLSFYGISETNYVGHLYVI